MPVWCPACHAVVRSGLRTCPDCGERVPGRRLPRLSGRTLIAAGLVLAIGAFWMLTGVDRAAAYLDALVEALGGR